MNRNLKIIYEDETMLVCDKKAGIAVQSARRGVQDLESMVKNYLVRKTGDRNCYVAVIHRLDQPVEGLVLFAKTKQAAANLSEQVKKHTAGKYYMAVTEGIFKERTGVLKDYLKKDSTRSCGIVTDAADKEAKEAQLEYTVLETGENCQLLKIHLLTGRFHQIRVQLSHSGHPIIGDVKYNPSCQDHSVKMFPALCAYRLEFRHPVTGQPVELVKKPEGKVFQEFHV